MHLFHVLFYFFSELKLAKHDHIGMPFFRPFKCADAIQFALLCSMAQLDKSGLQVDCTPLFLA